MSKVNLPYGIDNFAKVRESNCYYIDKTGFVKELLDRTFDGNLITRPRRFGKTLTISMLAEFFDIGKDSREIFDGLKSPLWKRCDPEGYTNVICYGAAFLGKTCLIKLGGHFAA